MEGELTDLLHEIERQISECDAAGRNNEKSSEPAVPGVITIGIQGDAYTRDLRDLRDRISNFARPCSDTGQHLLPLSDQPLLWKLLTFCRPSARFVDPSVVRERLGAFLRVRRRGEVFLNDGDYTQDLWANQHVERWITSDRPSTVFLETLFKTAPRVHQFVLELVDQLEEHHAVVCMLGGLPTSFADGLLSNLTPGSFLEQLTVQALRCVTLPRPLPFVLDNLQSFVQAKDCDDWFALLRKTCERIPHVSIVLDLAMIPLHLQDATRSWPMRFQRIGEELAAGPVPTIFQVLLLGPRRLFDECHGLVPVISVGDVLQSEHRFSFTQPSKRTTLRHLKGPEPAAEVPTSWSPNSFDRVESSSESRDKMVTPFFRVSNTTCVSHSLPNQVIEDRSLSAPTALAAAAPTDSCIARSCDDVSETVEETQPLSATGTSDIHQKSFAKDPCLRASSETHQAEASYEHPALRIPDTDAQNTSSKKRGPEPSDLRENLEDPSKSREQIKIALVCALPLEADAVRELFDEHWRIEGPMWSRMKSPGDTNAYSFGVMGGHPAVLVHMPGMGKGNGAMVATNCRNSFPGLKLALVVGICGGVPFYDKERQEIILGDVIVSEGLVQYDVGRRYPDKFMMRKCAGSVTGRPPPELRGLINKLKGRMDRRWMQERTRIHLQTLREGLGSEAEYPGGAEDQLFEGAYRHKHNDTANCDTCSRSDDGSNFICDAARNSACSELHCDKGKLVPRKRLDAIIRGAGASGSSSSEAPVVHFGYIACADQVMKSGEDRDNIARETGVIAFEMEGAGVWDMFPCLVIKAVCDYADSHKNKRWQNYAAATAAAYTKAFLEEWYM